MFLEKLTVNGLGGDTAGIDVDFNKDLNILTGKNGSGKTTALKLLWYIISGNIEHAIEEIPFVQVRVVTNNYTITINRAARPTPEIVLAVNGKESRFEQVFDQDGDPTNDPVEAANMAVKEFGASVFFPTFRRIEGGFSIRSSSAYRIASSGRAVRSASSLEDALQELSRRLSVGNHIFVASISTVDIVQLLMRQYTDMSERSNTLQQKTSQEIIDQIKNYKQEKSAPWADDPEKVLDTIRSMIEQLDGQREAILAPLTAVRVLAERLFQHAGIRLGTRLSFGDAANAVNSDSLSAGEKQMLSFICYNAFYQNSVIFIDEPELSLHVDWQRQLFSIMQSQGTANQFIVATHSPFIYGKFPDREIMLNRDRGDALDGL